MTAKSQLGADVEAKKQAISETEAEFSDWKKNIKGETERNEREYQRAIEKSKRDADNTKARQKTKEKTYDNKIKAIDEALKQIQKISETAPSN